MKSDLENITRTQQVRRHDIIQAAISTINKDGYAAASIDRIAKQAEMNKSNVLYHFKSKELIEEAVIGSAYEDGALYMKPYIEAATTLKDKLKAYITSNLNYIALHAEQIAAVHAIMNGRGPKDYNEEPILRLKQLLKMGQQTGEFGTFNAKIMATTIRQTIDSASFYIITQPNLNVDEYVQEIARLFENATNNKETKE